MGLTFDAVPGDLPLVERVWTARCDAEAGFTSASKTSSVIAFARHRDRTTVTCGDPRPRAPRR